MDQNLKSFRTQTSVFVAFLSRFWVGFAWVFLGKKVSAAYSLAGRCQSCTSGMAKSMSLS